MGCILVFYPEPVSDEKLTSFFSCAFQCALKGEWVGREARIWRVLSYLFRVCLHRL